MRKKYFSILFVALFSCGQKPATYSDAKLLLEKENYDGAIHILDGVIEQNPGFDSAYVDRAFAHGRLGNWENALEDYRHLSNNPAFKTQALIGRGHIYFAKSDYAKSIDEYTSAIRHAPDNADAYFYRGISYTFHKIPGQNPNGSTYHDLDNEQDFHFEYEKALADFNKAIRLDSLCTTCYIERANVYQSLQKPDPALSDYNKAVAISPKNAQAYSSRGLYYKYVNRDDLALIDLNKAIQLAPADPYLYVNRAYLYGETGNYSAACNDMKKAEQLGYELLPEDRTYCQ